MPYETSGSLTTDERTTSSSTGWDTQSEWDAYQSQANVTITDGTVQLAETTAVPENGVSRWNFESEGDTATATDSWGSNTLTLNNGPTYSTTAQVDSHALLFDGTDDEGVNTSFPDIGNQFTALAWINPQVSTFTDFSIALLNGNQGSSRQYKFLIQNSGDGNLRASIGNGSSASNAGSASYSQGVWAHIGVTYDGSTLTFYKDGSVNGSTNTSMTTYTTSDFYTGFGVNDSGNRMNYINAILDDVRVYDAALTESEVNSVYQNTV